MSLNHKVVVEAATQIIRFGLNALVACCLTRMSHDHKNLSVIAKTTDVCPHNLVYLYLICAALLVYIGGARPPIPAGKMAFLKLYFDIIRPSTSRGHINKVKTTNKLAI